MCLSVLEHGGDDREGNTLQKKTGPVRVYALSIFVNDINNKRFFWHGQLKCNLRLEICVSIFFLFGFE